MKTKSLHSSWVAGFLSQWAEVDWASSGPREGCVPKWQQGCVSKWQQDLKLNLRSPCQCCDLENTLPTWPMKTSSLRNLKQSVDMFFWGCFQHCSSGWQGWPLGLAFPNYAALLFLFSEKTKRQAQEAMRIAIVIVIKTTALTEFLLCPCYYAEHFAWLIAFPLPHGPV